MVASHLQSGPEFVCKSPAPYTLATLAGARRIACLYHEALDVAVKKAPVIVARGT